MFNLSKNFVEINHYLLYELKMTIESIRWIKYTTLSYLS
jgi:hypothetical protein